MCVWKCVCVEVCELTSECTHHSTPMRAHTHTHTHTRSFNQERCHLRVHGDLTEGCRVPGDLPALRLRSPRAAKDKSHNVKSQHESHTSTSQTQAIMRVHAHMQQTDGETGRHAGAHTHTHTHTQAHTHKHTHTRARARAQRRHFIVPSNTMAAHHNDDSLWSLTCWRRCPACCASLGCCHHRQRSPPDPGVRAGSTAQR